MKRMRIVLHIGGHKTGTSSIQAFMHANSARLNKKHGVFYPLTGRQIKGRATYREHHLLAWSVVGRYAEKFGKPQSVDLWMNLVQEIRNESPRVTVISSEFFWAATGDEIRQIRQYLSGFDVDIVLYVRNHLSLALSSYKQSVKTGKRSQDFDAFLREHLWRYDYTAVADRWREVFGTDHLKLRIYDKVKRNLIPDFADIVGIKLNSFANLAVTRNISPSDGLIRLLRQLNLVEKRLPGQRNALIQRVRRNILGRRLPGIFAVHFADRFLNRALVKAEHIQWLRSATQDMQTRFLEKYVSPEDRHYFDF